MDKDLRKKYPGRLTVKSIDSAITALVERGARNTALLLQVLLDVARHQGDSPANISDRLVSDRDSTTIQGMLKKLVQWGWIELVDVEYQHGESPRKNTFLTAAGAELLMLTTVDPDKAS